MLWHQLGPGSIPPFLPHQTHRLLLEQLSVPEHPGWIAANPAVLVIEVTEGQKWCNNT